MKVMKRGLFVSLAVIALLAVIVGVVYAFSIQGIDGIWGYIEGTTENSSTLPNDGGAICSRWATGPGDSPTSTSNWSTAIQSPPTNDENQVRYGLDAYQRYTGGWTCHDCANSPFGEQSGFGFKSNAVTITPLQDVPFYLGKFTHYNNPVFSGPDCTNTDEGALEWVDLTVSVPVTCNDGTTTTDFSFNPRFTLDETSNTTPCAYPGTTICPDKVTVDMPTTLGEFSCPEGEYTIVINGFTTEGLEGGDCSLSYNSAAVATEFITQENQDNHACLWASITAPTADIGPVKTCQTNAQGWISSFTVVTTNIGPGAAINPSMTDVLPTGVTYSSYTSTLTTTAGGTNPQGTCSYNSGTKTVSCNLLTPLPAPSVDANAKWTVVINVTGVTDTVSNTATVSSITTDPNTSNNSSTATCSPTAVTLTSFTASEVEGNVVLDWTTASEYNTLGFNIYTAASADGEKVKVNDSLLPSNVAPGSLEGAVYTYTAGEATTGETYYWLEEVDISGGTTLYGPAVLIITD